jgi:oligopeptide/dipeptide ABC transporter ATP-binding protein
MSADPILEVRNLRTRISGRGRVGWAVDGVSFELYRGETLGLVGESGSGKSLTCLSILRLLPAPAAEIIAGEVRLRGEDLLKKSERQMRLHRGGDIGMVLQDPTRTLNPVFRIGGQLKESLQLHTDLDRRGLRQRVEEMLRLLNIPSPQIQAKRYPHQLSGGMRQRAVGAVALSCNPAVLIADEPTTALDVTIEAAYLELLKDIQKDTGLSMLFVSHDFGVISRMCHRIAVMYAGRLVEIGDAEAVLDSPAHPYTEALIAAIPDINAVSEELQTIRGNPPSVFDVHEGCPFAPRCEYVEDRCWSEFPPESQGTAGQKVFCWLHV